MPVDVLKRVVIQTRLYVSLRVPFPPPTHTHRAGSRQSRTKKEITFIQNMRATHLNDLKLGNVFAVVLSTVSNMFSVNWTERLISPIPNTCKWYLTNTKESCNFTTFVFTVECVAGSIKTFLCCSFILTGWQCYTTGKQTEVFAWKHMQHYANNPFPVMCFASLCVRRVLHC